MGRSIAKPSSATAAPDRDDAEEGTAETDPYEEAYADDDDDEEYGDDESGISEEAFSASETLVGNLGPELRKKLMMDLKLNERFNGAEATVAASAPESKRAQVTNALK